MERLRTKENKISLDIFKQIDKLNLETSKRYGKINLISIFFLDIQKYLSSSFKSKLFKVKTKKKLLFPFVDYTYLYKNKKLSYFKNKKLNQSILDDNLKELNFEKILKIKDLIFKNISVYQANPNIFDYIKKKKLNYKKIYFSKIYLNNIDYQIKILENFLEKHRKKFRFKNKYFTLNFINWTKLFLSNKEKDNRVHSENLLVGTNMNIKSRITSAKYLLNKKKVISFAHANYSSLIYDDPVNECGDFTFCNKYYATGLTKFKKKYINSNLLGPKKIYYSKLKKGTKISQKFTGKFLYIPNSYNSFRRYGYYRDINDKDYLKWQSILLKENSKIFLKEHPKSRFDYQLSSSRIIRGTVKDSIEKFDLFIFDIISQPFFEIAKTNKKILYLDINQRVLINDIKKKIKDRAFVYKCNLEKLNNINLNNLIKKAQNFKIKNYDILKS